MLLKKKKVFCVANREVVGGQGVGDDGILCVFKKCYKESFKTIRPYDMHVRVNVDQTKSTLHEELSIRESFKQCKMSSISI